MTSAQTSLAVVLAFLGGAAVGGIAVYAAQPDNRRKIRDAVEASKRIASRVPAALEDVKAIANDAMHEARDTARTAVHDAGDAARQVVAPASPRLSGPRIA